MYFQHKVQIFQPATLVYRRVHEIYDAICIYGVSNFLYPQSYRTWGFGLLFFPLKDILVKAPQMSWHNISMRSMPETGHQKNKFFDWINGPNCMFYWFGFVKQQMGKIYVSQRKANKFMYNLFFLKLWYGIWYFCSMVITFSGHTPPEISHGYRIPKNNTYFNGLPLAKTSCWVSMWKFPGWLDLQRPPQTWLVQGEERTTSLRAQQLEREAKRGKGWVRT